MLCFHIHSRISYLSFASPYQNVSDQLVSASLYEHFPHQFVYGSKLPFKIAHRKPYPLDTFIDNVYTPLTDEKRSWTCQRMHKSLMESWTTQVRRINSLLFDYCEPKQKKLPKDLQLHLIRKNSSSVRKVRTNSHSLPRDSKRRVSRVRKEPFLKVVPTKSGLYQSLSRSWCKLPL